MPPSTMPALGPISPAWPRTISVGNFKSDAPPSRLAPRPRARGPQARLELGEAHTLGAAAMEIEMRREPAHRRGCDQGIDQKIGWRDVEAGTQRALGPEMRQLA